MSRIRTPQEIYRSYHNLLFTTGYNLRSLGGKRSDNFGYLKLTYKDENGAEHPYLTEEERKQLEQYRELSFLFENLNDVWKATESYPFGRKEFLDKLEMDLRVIETYDLEDMLNDLPTEIDRTLLTWYISDKSDYTQGKNNQKLCEYIYETVMGCPADDVDFNVYLGED